MGGMGLIHSRASKKRAKAEAQLAREQARLVRSRRRSAGRAVDIAEGMVAVRRADLEYLLAHYADEVHGSPDRAHWRLPLLAQACASLSGVLAQP